MKLIMEEISVQADSLAIPQRLWWRHHLYIVQQVVESWQYNGDWWLTLHLHGTQRHYYCIEAVSIDHEMVAMELFRQAGQWTLSRLLD